MTETPIFNVRRDMVIVGHDGRRHLAVDRELSPIGCRGNRTWLRLYLQDIESGVLSMVEYRGTETVLAEWPSEVADSKPM